MVSGTSWAGPSRPRPAFGSPDDSDRAVGVPKQGLADRAEQQPGEPAVPAGADDHEGGALGRLDERPGRGGVHDADFDLDGRVLQRPGGDRFGQRARELSAAVLAPPSPGPRPVASAAAPPVVDGADGVNPAAVPGRVLECILQCAVAAVRRVHTDDHLVPLLWLAPDDDHRARGVRGDLSTNRTEHQPFESPRAARSDHDLLGAGSPPDEFGGRVAVRDLAGGIDRRSVPDPDSARSTMRCPYARAARRTSSGSGTSARGETSLT